MPPQDGGRPHIAVTRLFHIADMAGRQAVFVLHQQLETHRRLRWREQMIDDLIIPGIAACPGVRSVKALWPRKFEDRDGDMVRQIVVELDSEEAIETMLASPERHAMRDILVGQALPLFESRVSHIHFETA
jgi:hypothetical protein